MFCSTVINVSMIMFCFNPYFLPSHKSVFTISFISFSFWSRLNTKKDVHEKKLKQILLQNGCTEIKPLSRHWEILLHLLEASRIYRL